MARAEQFADESGGRGRSREPGHAQRGTEDVKRQRRLGRREITCNRHRAGAVHIKQQRLHAMPLREPTHAETTRDVSDADDRQCAG